MKAHCRYCGIFQNDLWKHLRENPKHKTAPPKDRSNYKAYKRGQDYRKAKMEYQKRQYRKKHPKKMKLKDFF